MAVAEQVEIRCGNGRCNRRLADVTNEVERGQVVLEIKCPKCGNPHTEILKSR